MTNKGENRNEYYPDKKYFSILFIVRNVNSAMGNKTCLSPLITLSIFH